ncbi:MAG: hypothetical protein HDR88_14110 [Bacteroides sp.]|nr:hypothetical protein [Bacteroides sp.]
MIFEFVYADYQVATPEIVCDLDESTVIITCATEGAEIRYTLDGSEPTKDSNLYTEPIFVENGITVRVRAFADNLFDSEISEYEVSGLSGINGNILDGFKVCKEGSELVVYSDNAVRLPIYSLNGTLIRVADIMEGRNVIGDLQRGVYIIGNVKVRF